MENMKLPNFKIALRIGDHKESSVCSFDGDWFFTDTEELFTNKRILIFALPGAYTPTCTNSHLPDFEENYGRLTELGIDEIFCVATNDAFVMNSWFNDLNIKNVKPLPDGNCEITSHFNAVSDLSFLGMSKRSTRYAVIINNQIIEKIFRESPSEDNPDPYENTKAEIIIDFLNGKT